MDAKRLVLAGRTALTPASGVYHPPRQHLFTSSCRGCVQRAGALAAPQPQHIGITLTQKRDSLHRNRDHPDPPYTVPAESDMAVIFEAARLAGIVWLKFDSDAAIVDGLPIFEETDPL